MIDSDKKLDDLKAALSNIDIGKDKTTKPDWLSSLETWSLNSLDEITTSAIQTWSLTSSQLSALTPTQIPSITVTQLPNANSSLTASGVYSIPVTAGGGGGSGTVIYGSPGKQGSTKINLDGEDADITINGRSLLNVISNIEERLAILRPNTELEQEWDELKELGDRYRALENRIKDQIKTYETLKTMPKPDGF